MEEYQYHIFSPYRVCPIGTHVDHQHGLVTGFAINKGVDLWFNVREDSLVNLRSLSFEGEVHIDINKRTEVKEKHWATMLAVRSMPSRSVSSSLMASTASFRAVCRSEG